MVSRDLARRRRMRLLRLVPVVLSAFAALVLCCAVASAAPMANITVDNENPMTTQWVGVSGGQCVLSGTQQCYNQTIYQPGLTAGQPGTITVTKGVNGGMDVYICTGQTLTGSAPYNGTACPTHVGGVADGATTATLDYTVPSGPYYVLLGSASATVTGVVVVANQADAPTPGPGGSGSISFPTVDMSQVGDNVSGFFGFLAPVLWLVGGISIGGLLLHKARGMF